MLRNRNKLLVAFAIIVFCASLFSQKNSFVEKKYVIDENGDQLVMTRVGGRPPEILPEINTDLYKGPKLPGEVFYLSNTPGYDWSHGCTATATSIITGYYDNTGVVDAYTGGQTAVNGGLAPMTNSIWKNQTASQSGTSYIAMAATKQGVDGRDKRGHGDDYWITSDNKTDPYFGNWTEHTYSEAGYNHCTADYMGTNQWNNWGNVDGSTIFWNNRKGGRMYDVADKPAPDPSRDGCHGLRLYWEAKGYTVDINYNQVYLGYNDPDDDPDEGPTTEGFTFEDYMDQIDRGYPVLLQIVNHSLVGYGYNNTGSNQTVYVRDTWSMSTTTGGATMEWGTSYSGMDHVGVTVVEIGTESGWFAPRNLFALNDNRSVTVTWDDPSKGNVANIEYQIFKDGDWTNPIATGITTESYLDTDFDAGGADDGMHYYRIKSVYPSDSYTTIISGEQAAVYVSKSVTVFHDDFEIGGLYPDDQWLLSSGWGLCQEWVHGGSNSLSESPNANYTDNSILLPEGGSVGEIAPGLNFTAAADINMDFWFRYDIELSYDYMHLQVCKDGLNWVSLKVWDGETPAWAQENINLGLFAGEANVRLRFLFISDGGYTAEGSNIDDLNIAPSSVDAAPPYVYYTKDKSYYDNNANGFELITDITDFTGINFANVLYKVNGGGETTLAPASVNGDEYSYVIPEQNPGDYVEFRFDCEDTATGSNRSDTGPYFYQAGLHQKYDNTIINFYNVIWNDVAAVADPDTTRIEVICTKFTSFHEDLEGVVIRGYTDAGRLNNSDFIIHVYADDNGGMPGTELITPFSFANPAILSETNKWAYVDLSSYNLTDMTDFYIGLSSDNNVSGHNGSKTRSVETNAGLPENYDFGRAYTKQITAGASAPAVWVQAIGTNYHMRAVTTNYELSPPVIDPSTETLFETITTDATSSELLGIGNAGNFNLDYNATFEYTDTPTKSKAIINVETNDFESGLVYTNSGVLNFNAVAGEAVLSALGGGNGADNLSGILTSDSFDGTVCTALNLDFDQDLSTGGNSSITVEYYNGSAWVSIYTSSASVTGHQQIALPVIAANMQLRFTGSMRNRSSDSWSIDNVVVSGSEAVLPTWLTLDGSTTTSGTVAAAGNDNITIGYDAAGLTILGDYKATIHLTGTDTDPVDVDVTMTVVAGGSGPDIPANVVTSISAGNLVIDWDVSAGATGYDVYSSDDPYGTFILATSVGSNQYTVPASQAKLFYYIIATNAAKSAPRVTIKKSIAR